jgi:hypothetical protein
VNDILQFMFQDGHLTATEVVALRKTCRELNENPIRVLRSLNIARPEEIQDFIQRTYRVAGVTEKTLELLDDSFKALIPVDIAVSFGVFAVAENGRTLHVAMEDPSDKGLIHKLEFFLNRRVVPVAATIHHILSALNKLYEIPPDQVRLATVLETSRGIILGRREKRLAQGHGNEKNAAQITENSSFNPNGLAGGGEEQAISNLTSRAMAADPVLDTISETESADLGGFEGLSSETLDDALPGLDSASLGTETPMAAAAPDVGGDALLGDLQPGEMVFFGAGLPPLAPAPSTSAPTMGQPTTVTPMQALADLGSSPGSDTADMNPGDLVFFDSPSPAASEEIAAAPTVEAGSPFATESPTDDLADLGMDAASDPLADLGLDAPTEPASDLAAESASFNTPASTIDSTDFDLTDDLPCLSSEQAATDLVGAVPSASDLTADAFTWSNEELSTESLILPDVPALGESADLIADLAPSSDFEISPSDELDVQPAAEALAVSSDEIPSYPPEEMSRLTTAINATLVKLTFAPKRDKALSILNDRLGPLGLLISESSENRFRVEYQGRVIECDLKQPASLKDPLVDTIAPILRRLEKIRR